MQASIHCNQTRQIRSLLARPWALFPGVHAEFDRQIDAAFGNSAGFSENPCLAAAYDFKAGTSSATSTSSSRISANNARVLSLPA
jgi:hypothetical protein